MQFQNRIDQTVELVLVKKAQISLPQGSEQICIM